MKNPLKQIVLFLLFLPISLFAQLPQTRVVNATLRTLEPGLNLVPAKGKYAKIIDSLDKNLKVNPKDTTSLFYRALFYYTYNQMLAEPAQNAKGTIENLTKAKNMAESMLELGKADLQTKILRAQIYKELTYRLSGDENWKFTAAEIANRKKLYETYKAKANQYYDELAQQDKKNAYDYNRKKVK